MKHVSFILITFTMGLSTGAEALSHAGRAAVRHATTPPNYSDHNDDDETNGSDEGDTVSQAWHPICNDDVSISLGSSRWNITNTKEINQLNATCKKELGSGVVSGSWRLAIRREDGVQSWCHIGYEKCIIWDEADRGFRYTAWMNDKSGKPRFKYPTPLFLK